MAERSGSTPAATAVEADVLGACLSADDSSWWDIVRRTSNLDPASLFYDPQLAMVAHAIEAAVESSEVLNISTVEDRLLQRGGDTLPMSAREYLVSLRARSNVTTIKALRDHLAILVEKRSMRRYLTGAQRVIQDEILNGDSSSYEVASSLRLLAAEHVVHDEAVPNMASVIAEIENEEHAAWHVSTGLTKLDEILGGGYEPGRVYVVGAGPKVGKTTFCLNSTVSAVDAKVPVLFISLEMHKQEITAKLISIMSCIPHSAVTAIIERREKLSSLSPEEQADFRQSRQDLIDSKLHPAFVSDYGTINVDVISKMVLGHRALYGEETPVLVVVDYLQLLISSMDNRVGELSQITRTLKLLAMELNLPILVPSQINRKGSESESMPQVYQLRDGGTIEQDADVIIMLHRQINDDGSADSVLPSHIIEVNVARSRVGPSGMFQARWDGATSTIIDLEEGDAYTNRQPREAALVGAGSDDSDDYGYGEE